MSALTFRDRHEFVYEILEHEYAFGSYTMGDFNGAPAIVKGYGMAMGFFAELICDWEEIRAKLDGHETTREEYEEWKRTWDNGI